MKQLLLRKGRITVEDVPEPARNPNNILVEVRVSLISTGTEVASLQTSKASLLEKARRRPQDVKTVLQSLRVRGVRKTLELVQSRLDEFKPLGYSCAGRVVAVGENVTRFQAGDRVACAGAAIANHAEFVSVPQNLAVKIPGIVSDRAASFVTIGSIALQGVRRADVRLGEAVGVIGLGLIGQITVQLLKAAGCRVVGLDPDRNRVDAALQAGMAAGGANEEEFKAHVRTLTGGMGLDATLITASTDSNDPTRLAFHVTRKKGRIVVVGAVGMDLERSPFYEKEQDFLISCSYGPGRYDPEYEQHGRDYPYAYVRWTENRNMAAFLDLIGDARVDVDALIGAEHTLERSDEAFKALESKGEARPLAVILTYPETKAERARPAPIVKPARPGHNGLVRVGLIGGGNFAKTTHIPNLKALKDRAQVTAVCTASGANAASIAKQFNADFLTTDYRELLASGDVDAVVISTRHDVHAEMALEAIKAGKHVYLEKPLALTRDELKRLDRALRDLPNPPVVMVGFNRRYAPLAQRLKRALRPRTSPLAVQYRVNAGALPPGHWANGPEGGGRLRGEACHMVDFFRFLTDAPLEAAHAEGLRGGPDDQTRPDENFSAHFRYADGSVCDLLYTSLGHPGVPKERVEVHGGGRTYILDDFVSLSLYGAAEKGTSGAQDKGHRDALEAFFGAIRAGLSFPIPWEELAETTQACVELDHHLWGRLAPPADAG